MSWKKCQPLEEQRELSNKIKKMKSSVICDFCPTLIEKVGTKVTILSLIFHYGFKTGSWNFTLLYTSQDNTSV